MAKANHEFRALRESFPIFGKVMIAAEQFRHELSDHLFNIVVSRKSDFELAGISIGPGKIDSKWEVMDDLERYFGVSLPLLSIPGLKSETETKTRLIIHLAYNQKIINETDCLPYVVLTIWYPGSSQKKWQDHFKRAGNNLDKTYTLKAYATWMDIWPSKSQDYRRQNLDDIDADIINIITAFLKIL